MLVRAHHKFKRFHKGDTMNNQDFSIEAGATICRYTDCHAYTVIKRTKTTITLQRDKATLLNNPTSGEEDALKVSPGGFMAHVEGTQRYEYQRDEDGETVIARWNAKRNRYMVGSYSVIAGRSEHYDYNF